jgi:hypothetical protein
VKGGAGQLQFWKNGNNIDIDFENYSLINNANIPFCDITMIIPYCNQNNQCVMRTTNTRFNLGDLKNNEMCIISFSLKYRNPGQYNHIYRIIKIPINEIDFNMGRVSYNAYNEQYSEIHEEELDLYGFLPVLPILVLFASNKLGDTMLHPMYDLIKADENRNLARYCASPTINTNHYCMIFVKINNLYYTFDGSYATANNDIQTNNMYGVI